MSEDPVSPIGTARCRCSGCGRSFTTVSAFDRHHRVDRGGGAVCLDPAERGLVYRDGFWGWAPPAKRVPNWSRETPPRDEPSPVAYHYQQGGLL